MDIWNLNFGVSPPGRALFVCRVPFCRGFRQALWVPVPAPTGGFRFRPEGRVSFCSCRKKPKTRLGGVPPVRLRPPRAGPCSQSAHPLRTPERATGASVAVPSSPSGVLNSRLRSFHRRPPASCVAYALAIPPHRGAWPGAALRHGVPLEAQTRRLEHQDQAPIGGAKDCRARRQKAGGRRAWDTCRCRTPERERCTDSAPP